MKRFGILLLILFTLTGCTSKSSFGEYEVIIKEDSLYFINGTENYEEEGYNFHSVQKTLHVKDDFIYQIDTEYDGKIEPLKSVLLSHHYVALK